MVQAWSASAYHYHQINLKDAYGKLFAIAGPLDKAFEGFFNSIKDGVCNTTIVSSDAGFFSDNFPRNPLCPTSPYQSSFNNCQNVAAIPLNQPWDIFNSTAVKCFAELAKSLQACDEYESLCKTNRIVGPVMITLLGLTLLLCVCCGRSVEKYFQAEALRLRQQRQAEAPKQSDQAPTLFGGQQIHHTNNPSQPLIGVAAESSLTIR